MTVSRVAYRYAEAILDALPEGTGQDLFFRDLDDLARSVANSRELRLFFESPVLTRAQKLDALDPLFADRLQPYMIDVLKLLVDKRRESQVLEIVTALHQLRRRRNNIRVSDVSTAVELDEAQRQALRRMLEAVSNSTIEASWHVDPALKGGVVVRLDDTVYDGSVAQQLRRLRQRFASGT